MSVESVVDEMTEYGNACFNPLIGQSIEEFGQRILAAVEAERREWQKERLTWERRVKMAASMAKAKAFNNNQNKED